MNYDRIEGSRILSRHKARLAVIILPAILGACASLVETRVEQTVLEALPRMLGPATRYVVTVNGVTTNKTEHELNRVHAVGERVERPRSPVLDRIEVDLYKVRIDREERKVLGLGGADATVRVLASDVAAYLEQRPGLDSVSVAFLGSDVVSVSARPSVAGYALPTNVSVRGYLVPHGPELRLNLVDVRAAGFPVGNIATFVIERLINPIADLSALSVPADITGARVAGDTLIVTATGTHFISEEAYLARTVAAMASSTTGRPGAGHRSAAGFVELTQYYRPAGVPVRTAALADSVSRKPAC